MKVVCKKSSMCSIITICKYTNALIVMKKYLLKKLKGVLGVMQYTMALNKRAYLRVEKVLNYEQATRVLLGKAEEYYTKHQAIFLLRDAVIHMLKRMATYLNIDLSWNKRSAECLNRTREFIMLTVIKPTITRAILCYSVLMQNICNLNIKQARSLLIGGSY